MSAMVIVRGGLAHVSGVLRPWIIKSAVLRGSHARFPGTLFNGRFNGASQVVLSVKNAPANAGDVRHVGPIPGSGRSPG